MCRFCGEIVGHFLLHCRKAYRLWSFVFRTFAILWVPSHSVTGFLFSWWNWLGKHSSHIWNLVPLCLTWCIWRDRNRWTFEDMDRLDDQLLALFSRSLFDWSRAWDSHLVILSLCSLALSFFVISASFLFFFFVFCFFFFVFVLFDMLCATLHLVVFWLYISYLSKKEKEKKKNRNSMVVV